MRTVAILLLLPMLQHAAAQGRVLINEVQVANQGTFVDPLGRTPDWIELYNPGTRPVQVQGMRLVITGRIHPINDPLSIPSKGHLLLQCSGHPERGADHVGFTLPRSGGTLLLIDADGTSILDLFTWPPMESGLSMGRLPDGEPTWSYFEHPTPGTANRSDVPLRARTPPPQAALETVMDTGAVLVHLSFDPAAQVHYTVDGSRPTRSHGLVYTGPFIFERNAPVRAMAWRSGEVISRELLLIAPASMAEGPAMHVVIDPEDLHGPLGIDVSGEQANYSRTGKDWERPVLMELRMDHPVQLSAGMRVSGSGSRGCEKRSFKLVARDRYDSPDTGLPFADGTHFREGILRADAGPHAFLRNRFMEALVLRHGLNVDVQPSTPLALYMNGSYHGQYRWMPPKDAEWARHVLNTEAADVLEGPAGVALSGSDKHFSAVRTALLTHAPMERIDALIETGSLIDLACIDLWTGRADHDINVRCHRPRQSGGRWRWVLFDMDLWTPPDENSVERMCSATVPETPYLPQLLAHPELQLRLLARITALQGSAFHPTMANHLADSIHHAHLHELQADHQRWGGVLAGPGPAASLGDLQRHITARPAHLFQHLAAYTGRRVRKVTVDVPGPDLGRVLLDGMALPPGRQELLCFSGIPMRLEAVAADGVEFAGWKHAEQKNEPLIGDLSAHRSHKPLFRTMVP